MATIKRTFTDAWFAALKPPATGQESYRDGNTRLYLRNQKTGKRFYTTVKLPRQPPKNYVPVEATDIESARAKCEDMHRGYRALRGKHNAVVAGGLPTLRDRIETYLLDRKRPLITADDYRDSIAKHFEAYLDKPVDALTPEIVDDLRRRNGVPGRALSCLHAVVNKFVRKGKMADPLADLPNDAMEQEKRPLIEALVRKPERLHDVIKHGYGYGNPALGLLNELCLFTGLRPNELIKLRWDHLDLAKCEYWVAMTKQGKPLTLPMSAHVAQLLLDWKKRRHDNHPFVFPHKEKAKRTHMDPTGYKKMPEHVRKMCGPGFNGGSDEPEKHWHLYQQRKAFDSIGAVRAEIDHAIVCCLTGRSIGGSRAAYMFATPDALRPSIEKITDVLLTYTTARKAKAA